jgi:nitrate reductase NapD
MNLSSIIVLAKPGNLDEVIRALKASDEFEYHLHDKTGRIIVTIEGVDTEEEIRKLKKLNAIPHVISAEMVFAYSEEELENDRDKLEKLKDNLPNWLNDPDADIIDIKYGGDLKGRY